MFLILKKKKFDGSEDIDIRDWYLHLLIFIHYKFEKNPVSTIDFDVDIPGYEVAWEKRLKELKRINNKDDKKIKEFKFKMLKNLKFSYVLLCLLNDINNIIDLVPYFLN